MGGRAGWGLAVRGQLHPGAVPNQEDDRRVPPQERSAGGAMRVPM